MTLRARTAGLVILGALSALALGADSLVPNPPHRQFSDFVHAPPMRPRILDAEGRVRPPFLYPLRLDDRLARTYREDRRSPARLRFFHDGVLLSTTGPDPWFPLGTDGLGRDVFARLAAGARVSIAIAILSVCGALLLGVLVGASAGYAGGWLDALFMRVADFVLALPALYVVLALRSSAPLVLEPSRIFWTIVAVFVLAGWPAAARGVRALVAAARNTEYAEAARAAGAGPLRILHRHLLPATRGFVAAQAGLLLPAFVIAEASLSYVGLGFAEPAASWGLMLREAGGAHTVVDAPWLLAPAAGIALLALAGNLVASAHENVFIRHSDSVKS